MFKIKSLTKEAFSKSSKKRKEKLAEHFKTDIQTLRDYFKNNDSLNMDVVFSEYQKKETTVHVITVLDTSGSMSSKINKAVDAINEEITQLSKDVNSYLYSFISFSNKITNEFLNKDLNSIDKIKYWDFGKLGWSTKLNDVIIHTIDLVEQGNINGSTKYLIKIFTDGLNNGSNASYKLASKAIKSFTKGTITFVGTSNDINQVINVYKIDKSNTLSYDNTGKGLAKAINTSTQATTRYSEKVVKGEDVSHGFYKVIN